MNVMLPRAGKPSGIAQLTRLYTETKKSTVEVAAKERDELKGRNAYLQQNYAEARDNQKILGAQLARVEGQNQRLRVDSKLNALNEARDRIADLERLAKELNKRND